MVSETLRGMPGAAPGGRRGLGVTGPGGGGAGGAGGARPSGTGMGGLPVPIYVEGRLTVSRTLVCGRLGTSNDIVEVGRSARTSQHLLPRIIDEVTSSIYSALCRT
jgi:hypothetical protein